MQWRQFVMNLDAIDPDRAATVLTELGAQSITLTDAGDNPILEPAPGETPLWTDTRVTALFSANTDFVLLRKALLDALSLRELPTNYDEVLEDRPWEREWLRDFAPMQFGKRLWVTPSHMAVDDAEATVIELDPGLAFGTGTHATTALCLEWLDGIDLRDKSVLDFGCGSGILAIAAARLGASAVRAIDIDEQAITATQQNAAQNGVDTIVSAATDIDAAATFDVVVANILAGTLIDGAAALCDHLKPGGTLVLSGILSGQVDSVAGAYRDLIDFAEPKILEEWALLVGKRH